MRFLYGKQEMRTLARSQENCFLLTNGLGGYASVTAAYSVNRCDQGILISAVKAPNERVTLVHRMSERLTAEGKSYSVHPGVRRRHRPGGGLQEPELLPL